MRPARIVAVTQLLLDVLDEMEKRSQGQMSPAEEALFYCAVFSRTQLEEALTLARAEMAGLAPAVLATPDAMVTSASQNALQVRS